LTMHGLKSAAGFVQTKVADRLTTRYVPHITFVLDEGVKQSVEIARIIREENEQLAADRAAAGIVEPTADAAGEDESDEHADAENPTEQSGPAADGPADQPA
jgi:ribosome-binding factor A